MDKILKLLGLKKPDPEPPPPNMTLSAIVFRADGTVEDHGVISTGYVSFTPETNKE